MHRPIALSSAIFAAVIAVAGCGAAKGALSGKDPNTAVQDAVRQAQSTSLHLALKGSFGVDRSDLANVPAEIDSALSAIGKGGSASGQVDQESSTRRKLTGQVEGGKSATLVQYDGKLFASDDGTHFSEVTSKDTGMQSQLASFDLSKIVSAFNFQDSGADTQDGRSVEHYTAALTVDTLNKLAQNLGASSDQMKQLQQFLALAAPFTKLDRGSLDVWLSPDDGSLVRLDLSGAGKVDVGGLGALAAGVGATPAAGVAAVKGHLGLTVELDAHVSQLGTGIHVSKPSVSSSGASGATPSGTP